VLSRHRARHFPPSVVFSEIVTTRKAYMRLVSRVEPEWLLTFHPTFFRDVS
jgi:hypothetical protein